MAWQVRVETKACVYKTLKSYNEVSMFVDSEDVNGGTLTVVRPNKRIVVFPITLWQGIG